MENPFSAVAIAATAEVIVDIKEQVSYQTTKMQREIILTKLKEKGCRITKQRLRLIDIILQNECSSCKEIFYRALEEDDKLGSKKHLDTIVATKKLQIEGMSCANCQNRIENAINGMAQVNAKASFKKGEAIVKLGADIPEEELRESVEKLGYKVTSIELM